MEISKALYVTNRKDWRTWLERHNQSEPEIWLVYYRKSSGRPRIDYNDAVEEALCFGWIDSNVKRIDEERYAQRFSPRKSSSGYSQANKERLRRLVQQGKVIPSVLATIEKDGLLVSEFDVPKDILEAIRADKGAWKNYQKLPDAYRRIRIGFIEGARRRPDEFKKRLDYFIRMTRENKFFGFGGIDVYYQDTRADANNSRGRR